MKFLISVIGPLLLVLMPLINGAEAHSAPYRVRHAISGRVTDPNGAVVVGAKITIVGRASHTTVVRKSNAKGEYVADLMPDTYDVTAAAPGFKTATRSTGVVRGSRSYMDFVLYPGDVGSPRIIIP